MHLSGAVYLPSKHTTYVTATQQIIECSQDVIFECYIRVTAHSSVNVRLMLNNILRQKLCNALSNLMCSVRR